MQRSFALGSGDPTRDVDQVTTQGGPAGHRVGLPGQSPGGAEQVVGDRRQHRPRTICWEQPGRQVSQRSVDEVGEHRFDDRMLAVGDIRVGHWFGVVGEERVVPPDGEEFVMVTITIPDPPDDEPGGDLLGAVFERGVFDLGDLGVGDQIQRLRTDLVWGRCRLPMDNGVVRRRIVRPTTIPPGGAGIGPLWRVCDVQLTVDAVAGRWRSGRYPSVSSLASSPSMSTVMVPKKLTLSWWVGHRWASTSSWIRWPPVRISAMARP